MSKTKNNSGKSIKTISKSSVTKPDSAVHRSDLVGKQMRLDASVPANNQKIIEIYNKIRKQELDPSPDFQRKLVWKKQHKIRFIDTILHNYPFPEVYLAPDPSGPDLSTLTLKDLIVDGQQRLTTIVNYIEGKDIFATEGKLSIPKFFELDKISKADFLNYEVSVRYLKNADRKQIKDVFERINSTEYALNNIERTNAQWGESEFICFAKQVVEKDLDVDTKYITYKIDTKTRNKFVGFFNDKYSIFTESDVNRMLALQYVMTLLATVCERNYFDRNSKVKDYIVNYYDEFINAGEVEQNLSSIIDFIDSLSLGNNSFWFSKTNLFTLMCELFPFERKAISKDLFRSKLLAVESGYKVNTLLESMRTSSALTLRDLEQDYERNFVMKVGRITDMEMTAFTEMPQPEQRQYLKYFEYSREGVNNKAVREFRGSFIRAIIVECLQLEA